MLYTIAIYRVAPGYAPIFVERWENITKLEADSIKLRYNFASFRALITPLRPLKQVAA